MKFKTLAGVLLLSVFSASAQDTGLKEESKWYFGIGGGYHTSFMSISDIDTDIFPTNKNWNSGVFSVFVRGAFGDKHQWAVRPELSFVNRGGRLTEIYSKWYAEEDPEIPLYEYNGINDIYYKFKGQYVDLRLPLMYRFGNINSRFRPYVYVAPIAGFCHGGYVAAGQINNVYDEVGEQVKGSTTISELHVDASKANTNAFYFAAAVGVGVDYNFNVGRHLCSLGLELNYEHGLTNTFGDDSDAKNMYDPYDLGYNKIGGTRKLQGLEIKMTLGIPFSIFKKAPVEPVYTPVTVSAPVSQLAPVSQPAPEPEPEPVIEKPCYSLDEVIDMMQRGENVKGKTICAIDDAINFDYNKSVIKKTSYDYLNRLADILIRTNDKVIIKGHTDNVGSKEFNLNLSRDRALAVYNYLISKGVPSSRLSYEYFGFSKPIESNATEEGRRMNRRVEFEIVY